MELYILDSLLRRDTVVDKFKSCIWTERLNTWGDCELVLRSSPQTRSQWSTGVQFMINESYRIMEVETIEDKKAADGTTFLNVKSRSIEKIMDDRAALAALDDTTTVPNWTITDLPADVMRKIFHDICVTGVVSVNDIIPFIHEGSEVYPTDTIAEPSASVIVALDPMSVYSAETQIGSQYGLGFRLIRPSDSSGLYFDVYAGSDRTTGQTTLSAVVFSPDLDNLQNTSELTSSAAYKNVAYVVAPNGAQEVVASEVDPEIEGFQRRVLMVNANDITLAAGTDLDAALLQRGLDELAKNRNIYAFDGELSQNGQYKYGIDYNLGDLVEVRNVDGVTNQMQVTEQIFVSDEQGDRSYPTLAVNLFITPGSWAAWPIDEEWIDVDVDLDWADA